MLVRLYAVAREIAGRDEVRLEVASLPEAAAQLSAGFGERMARLVEASTFLHDGTRYRSHDALPLGDGDTVDLLPPFAGG